MDAPALPPGAFIWCRFPLREAHREPGPKNHLHLVYVKDTAGDKAVSIYTTSVTWLEGTPVPFGVLPVSTAVAATMGQKPFVLDARRIGILPMTKDWFPDIEAEKHGVVAVASSVFRRHVDSLASEIAKRQELIEWYGPGAPDIDKSKRPK